MQRRRTHCSLREPTGQLQQHPANHDANTCVLQVQQDMVTSWDRAGRDPIDGSEVTEGLFSAFDSRSEVG